MTETQPISAPETVPSPRKSKGEKLFDFLVYGPMNLIGTFLLTIPVAWSIEHGMGSTPFAATKNFLTNRLHMKETVAQRGLKTSALMMGGNIMLFPVRWAENSKPAIVAGLNRMLGDKTQHAQGSSEPLQDWGSLLKGRALAWATVFASFTGLEWAIGEKKTEAISEGFAHRLCDRFGWKKQETVLLEGVAHTRPTRAFGYSKIAAFDIFATLAAGALLYFGSRFFAKKRDDKHEYREGVAQLPSRGITRDSTDDAPVAGTAPTTAIKGERQREGALQDASPMELAAQR